MCSCVIERCYCSFAALAAGTIAAALKKRSPFPLFRLPLSPAVIFHGNIANPQRAFLSRLSECPSLHSISSPNYSAPSKRKATPSPRRSRPRPSPRSSKVATSWAVRRPVPARRQASHCRYCSCWRRTQVLPPHPPAIRCAHWCWYPRANSRHRSRNRCAPTANICPCARRWFTAASTSSRRSRRCIRALKSSSPRRGGYSITCSKKVSTSRKSAYWCSTRRTACSTWALCRISNASSPHSRRCAKICSSLQRFPTRSSGSPRNSCAIRP